MQSTLLIFIIVSCALAALCLVLLIVLLARRSNTSASLQALSQKLAALENSKTTGDASLRGEINHQFQALSQISMSAISGIGSSTSQQLEEMRATMDRQLAALRGENQKSLDRMQAAVDTRLSETLKAGLDTSFHSVSTQLEQVFQSMGEMRAIAGNITDLRNILSGVKNRGTWGEVQLSSLMRDILAPSQFEEQMTIPGSQSRVDFAIKLPGKGSMVYLPIDSKFPMDRYTSVLLSEESGDAADIAAAKNGLIRAVLEEARSIRKKYVSPPHTTDFAILFVPSEGLYAMLAAEDLLYTLQRDEKILLCGPSTLAALLNSLQVGFQTLAIEQQSGEILKLLSAVKKSFGSFSANLESTRRSIHAAANNLERAAGNSRSIQQKLRAVAEADIYEAQALLGEEFVLEEKEENHED
jgi:DNA recombination protein RmuC